MYSQFASLLRGLVLPFGAITGTRIVLDGVNGRISVFNVSDDETIRIDSATSTIAVTGPNDSAVTLEASGVAAGFNGSAGMTVTPQAFVGQTWIPGVFGSFITQGLFPQPAVTINSPLDSTANSDAWSNITLYGGSSVSDDTAIFSWCTDYQLLADILRITPTSSALSVTATIDGEPIVTRVASISDTSASAGFTTETITDSITFTSIVGVTYRIEWDCSFTSTTTADQALMRLRLTNITGTILKGNRTANTAITGGRVSAEYTATATSTVIKGTTQRVGAGTLTRNGSATDPSVMTVDRVS
jgi:hypothetical protein